MLTFNNSLIKTLHHYNLFIKMVSATKERHHQACYRRLSVKTCFLICLCDWHEFTAVRWTSCSQQWVLAERCETGFWWAYFTYSAEISSAFTIIIQLSVIPGLNGLRLTFFLVHMMSMMIYLPASLKEASLQWLWPQWQEDNLVKMFTHQQQQ